MGTQRNESRIVRLGEGSVGLVTTQTQLLLSKINYPISTTSLYPEKRKAGLIFAGLSSKRERSAETLDQA